MDHITFTTTNYPIALFGVILLVGLIFAFFGGIPFFGVLGPEDVKLFKDMGQQFNLEWLSDAILKLGRFFYYLNPFHKKPQK